MRVLAAVLSLVLCVASARADGAREAFAELTQIALSPDQVAHYLAAMPEMRTAIGGAPADAPEPDADMMARLDKLARKYGFRDFDEYNTVAGNIALALEGVDPLSKTYIGADKVIAQSIESVKTDKQMKEADRAAAIAELQAQLKAIPAVQFKGNIDLVVKNYVKLMGE